MTALENSAEPLAIWNLMLCGCAVRMNRRLALNKDLLRLGIWNTSEGRLGTAVRPSNCALDGIVGQSRDCAYLARKTNSKKIGKTKGYGRDGRI